MEHKPIEFALERMKRSRVFADNIASNLGSQVCPSTMFDCSKIKPPAEIKKGQFETKIYFLDTTTNGALIHLNQLFKDIEIIALNFANDTYVGGGVINGAIAQEESLCLTSPSLWNSLRTYGVQNGDSFSYRDWGIWNRRIIYTQNAEFVRDGDLRHTTPYSASIITAAAPNNKGISYEKAKEQEQEIERLIEKIVCVPFCDSINRSDIRWSDGIKRKINFKNKPILVLGAFGCGAFLPHNRQSEYKQLISTIFFRVLSKYKNLYGGVCFAIPKARDGNYEIFYETCKMFKMNVSVIKELNRQDVIVRPFPALIDCVMTGHVKTPKKFDFEHYYKFKHNCFYPDCRDTHYQHYAKFQHTPCHSSCKYEDNYAHFIARHKIKQDIPSARPSAVVKPDEPTISAASASAVVAVNRCGVSGCLETHSKHICRNCRAINSHLTRNCPIYVPKASASSVYEPIAPGGPGFVASASSESFHPCSACTFNNVSGALICEMCEAKLNGGAFLYQKNKRNYIEMKG
jgi:uncharacterized protein (TIGR02452 family)